MNVNDVLRQFHIKSLNDALRIILLTMRLEFTAPMKLTFGSPPNPRSSPQQLPYIPTLL